MEFYKKLNPSALNELFTIYTKRFIKVLLRGEQYPGEYDRCKKLLNQIQSALSSMHKSSGTSSTANTGLAIHFQ